MLNRGTRVLSVAAVVLGGALLLGACGNSSHIASGPLSGLPGTSATSTSQTNGGEGARSTGTTISGHKSTAATSGTSGTSGSSQSTGSSGQEPTFPVNQQTLSAFEAQLGALGQSLSQAVSGVDNTQGDS